MATNKNITMKQYNGLDYDTLYPKTTPEQVGAVSYEVQTLTYTQQTQARTNINAAPGGFGLGGGAKALTPADNLNDVWQAGWYAWDTAPQNAPTIGGSLIPYCSMNVLNKGSSYNTHQIVQTFEGYEIHRYYDGSKQTWSEWAWANPPMRAGVEYRTTENFLEKPVYVQLIDFGYGPNNSNAHVTKTIANIDTIVRWSGTASDGTAFPFANHTYSPTHVLDGIVYKDSNALHIDLYTNENKSKVKLYVSVFYTKNPD